MIVLALVLFLGSVYRATTAKSQAEARSWAWTGIIAFAAMVIGVLY